MAFWRLFVTQAWRASATLLTRLIQMRFGLLTELECTLSITRITAVSRRSTRYALYAEVVIHWFILYLTYLMPCYQDFTTRFPEERIVSIVFNPVQHVPIVLTAGVFDANGAVLSFPTLYRFILANGTEVFQATTNITNGAPAGGTLQCKRNVFSPSPTFATPTLRYAMSSALVCLLLSLGLFV